MPELNEKIKSLFPDRRIVAFYIHHCAVVPDAWMVALGQELRKLGFAVIGLLAGDAITRMNLDGLDRVFHADPGDIQHLDAIACFIVTDFERRRYPQSSRVLACRHSTTGLPDPGAYPLALRSISVFDGYLVGFPFAHRRREFKELWDNFPPPEKNFRPSSEFYLMGYGYAKLELMQREYHARMRKALPPRSICYAPTILDCAPYCGGQRVRKHGKRIIRTLLAAFPGHDIIFRPPPLNFDDPLFLEIADAFAGEPRFRLDLASSYLDTFVATQVMVTDFAHIAQTFSITTLRPAVYFQPWNTAGASRDYYLYSTNTYTNLVATIRNALQLPPADSEILYRKYGFLPTENTIERLARAIPDFIDARPHEDWLVIRREKQSPGISPSKMIMAILADKYLRSHLPFYAPAHARFLNSRPLAVFALHVLQQQEPETIIPEWLISLVGLEPGEGERRCGDIGREELVRLYMAAAENEKAHSRQEKNVILQDVATLYELARLAADGTPL